MKTIICLSWKTDVRHLQRNAANTVSRLHHFCLHPHRKAEKTTGSAKGFKIMFRFYVELLDMEYSRVERCLTFNGSGYTSLCLVRFGMTRKILIRTSCCNLNVRVGN